MNVKEILDFKRPEKSFYDILGCDISSTNEQITREYKIKALQFHPDKNPSSESLEKFKQLQLAKEILLDENKRKIYDLWLNCGLSIPFEQFRSRRVQHSMHWASPRSTNLSIQDAINKGQGSDESIKNNLNHVRIDNKIVDCSFDNGPKFSSKTLTKDIDWLDKFRRYEV